MEEIIIYEGIMCCSTGLCGPEPDQKLIEFNEAVSKMKEKVDVKRVNLSSHVNFFNNNKEIIQEIQKSGVVVLPITSVDNKIVMRGKYPSYEDLKKFTGGKNQS